MSSRREGSFRHRRIEFLCAAPVALRLFLPPKASKKIGKMAMNIRLGFAEGESRVVGGNGSVELAEVLDCDALSHGRHDRIQPTGSRPFAAAYSD